MIIEVRNLNYSKQIKQKDNIIGLKQFNIICRLQKYVRDIGIDVIYKYVVVGYWSVTLS